VLIPGRVEELIEGDGLQGAVGFDFGGAETAAAATRTTP
jgi:hypothetical protein